MSAADPLSTRVPPALARLIESTGEGATLRIDARTQLTLWAALLLGGEDGVAELAPGSRDAAGRLRVHRHRDPRRYPQAAEPPALADRSLAYAADGYEVFCGPLARGAALPGGAGVTGGRVLWADLDDEGALARLMAFRPRPCLIVASGGPGHAHGYWRLARRLPGRALEDANGRLARALDGDPAVKDRGRLMRLPGTYNGRHERPARLLYADLRPVRHELEGVLGPSTAPTAPPVCLGPPRRLGRGLDPLRDVEPAAYFHALCGVEPNRDGFVHCPLPDHDDETPSCHLYPTADLGWWCFGCCRGGRVYDLASLLLGGPWGRDLRGEPFRRARDLVRERFGLVTQR